MKLKRYVSSDQQHDLRVAYAVVAINKRYARCAVQLSREKRGILIAVNPGVLVHHFLCTGTAPAVPLHRVMMIHTMSHQNK